MNIQKAVIVVYGLANSFYKEKTFTAWGSDSANDTVYIKIEYQGWEISINAVYGDAF